MSSHTPFEDLERFVDELQAQFEHRRPGERHRAHEHGDNSMLDLVEYDDEYVVMIDLPGYDKSDVDVTLDDRTLTVTAEHVDAETTDDRDGRYIRRQRREVASVQEVAFPQEVDSDAATAKLNDGLLTVTVPKRDDLANGTHIDVE